jgi:hypothetical protein
MHRTPPGDVATVPSLLTASGCSEYYMRVDKRL